MKQIKKRRRILRIGNPVGFSLFCLVCLALMAGLYLGISWAIKNGPGVVKAMRTAVQEEVMTTPTVEPSREPKDELLPTATPTPSPTPEVKETPALGTPVATTPTPEPEATAFVTAGPAGDISASLYGQIIGIDPARDSKSKYTSEAANNLILAAHVKRYLESQGATVVLSRTEDTKGALPNEERGRIFKKANCTYVVRLMCNHISSKTSAAYVQVSKDNKEFGQKMIDAYVEATGMHRQTGGKKSNGLEVKSDSVASDCGCPCALLILGNWDNSTDKKNLQDETFMDRVCEGIYNGLMAQINGEQPRSSSDADLQEEMPAISTQPTDVTVTEGSELSLTVAAIGPNLKYQWELKTPLGTWAKLTNASARTANLKIPNIQVRHTGYTYRCTVSNKYGSVTSNVVTLTVKPASTSQP